jgi:hypothetical protein
MKIPVNLNEEDFYLASCGLRDPDFGFDQPAIFQASEILSKMTNKVVLHYWNTLLQVSWTGKGGIAKSPVDAMEEWEVAKKNVVQDMVVDLWTEYLDYQLAISDALVGLGNLFVECGLEELADEVRSYGRWLDGVMTI